MIQAISKIGSGSNGGRNIGFIQILQS